MPVVVTDQTYYRTADVCRMIGISRNTLFWWLKQGIVSDVEYWDFRGWGLFTLAQVGAIRPKIDHVCGISRSK